MNTTRTAFAGALALGTFLALAPMGSALANDADVIRQGSCSSGTDWKLKASPENGRIEVEGEIDSNKSGQDWNWRLVHDGSVSAKGTKTTSGPSGSFEVRRVVVNNSGTDSLVFKATRANGSETCRGVVNF